MTPDVEARGSPADVCGGPGPGPGTDPVKAFPYTHLLWAPQLRSSRRKLRARGTERPQMMGRACGPLSHDARAAARGHTVGTLRIPQMGWARHQQVWGGSIGRGAHPQGRAAGEGLGKWEGRVGGDVSLRGAHVQRSILKADRPAQLDSKCSDGKCQPLTRVVTRVWVTGGLEEQAQGP